MAANLLSSSGFNKPLKGESALVTCGWPTTSSKELGRIRAANGAVTNLLLAGISIGSASNSASSIIIFQV